MRDRRNREFARLLLEEGERRHLSFMSVCFAVDAISRRDVSYSIQPIKTFISPNIPWWNSFELKLRDLTNTVVLSSVNWNDCSRLSNVYPDGAGQGV